MTGNVPGALQERPVLEPHLWYYRDIYGELAGSRSHSASGDPLPIPVSEVLAYCQMYHIDGLDERETLCTMVRALDRAFLTYMREKTKQTAASSPRRMTRK